MTRNSVTNQLSETTNLIPGQLAGYPDEVFFTRKNDTWSPAEQVKHLELAVKPLILAFILPGVVLRILFGKPNRPGRDYQTLLAKYHKKLAEGAKASAPYVPKPLPVGTDKQGVFDACMKRHQKLLRAAAKMPDARLDAYILPHPLLGKITLREMLFFTDFHIRHHLENIQTLYGTK